MKILIPILSLLMMVTLFPAKADDSNSHSKIESAISAANPNAEITSISPSPISGLMEVQLNGREYIYITESGEYLLTGKLLNFNDGKFIDLTEEKLREIREKKLSSLEEENLVTFPSEGDELYEIFVFTDVSCGYCVNFHQHIEEITQRGITVHYLAFPRSGPSSDVGRIMENVWCSDEPTTALTRAKKNEIIEEKNSVCHPPIKEQYELGVSLGVKGTPAIYNIKGRQLGGYLTPDQLLQKLGL